MPSKKKASSTRQARVPSIHGWAPLEIAEQTLFPTIDTRDLSSAQRAEALAYAKHLLYQRTGILLEP